MKLKLFELFSYETTIDIRPAMELLKTLLPYLDIRLLSPVVNKLCAAVNTSVVFCIKYCTMFRKEQHRKALGILGLLHPWPLHSLSSWSPWPAPPLVLTFSELLGVLGLSHPWPLPNLSSWSPWPAPSLALTFSELLGVLGLLHPWPLPHLNSWSPWPAPDLALTFFQLLESLACPTLDSYLL